ncbi:MAG: NAD(P)/FAD-dependent oxidoreductase, partial [bacterium]
NGGQVNPNWKVLPRDIRKFYTDEEFDRMIRTVNQTCDLVFQLIEKYQIQCDAIRPGYVLGVVGKSGLQFVDKWAQQWRVVGAEVEPLSKTDISSIVGTGHYDGGMLDRRGGSIQPLSYARGLAKACQDNGVAIFGDSPAISIAPLKDGWSIRCAKGEVNCRKVVIGTNGYTDGCWPGLKEAIVPVASLITSTKPLKAEIADRIIPHRNAVSEWGGVPHYYQIDAGKRMVFGGRGSVTGKIGKLDTQGLRRTAIKLFPALKDAEWEYDWGGYVAMTTHHRPMLLKLDGNVFAGLGYNGRGVAMATMMGKQLALLCQGERPDLTVDNLQKIPFHYFHPMGIASRIISGHLLDRFTRRA